jgi:hypothetical protein
MRPVTLYFAKSRIRCCAESQQLPNSAFLQAMDTDSGPETRLRVVLPACGAAIEAWNVAPLALTQYQIPGFMGHNERQRCKHQF